MQIMWDHPYPKTDKTWEEERIIKAEAGQEVSFHKELWDFEIWLHSKLEKNTQKKCHLFVKELWKRCCFGSVAICQQFHSSSFPFRSNIWYINKRSNSNHKVISIWKLIVFSSLKSMIVLEAACNNPITYSWSYVPFKRSASFHILGPLLAAQVEVYGSDTK